MYPPHSTHSIQQANTGERQDRGSPCSPRACPYREGALVTLWGGEIAGLALWMMVESLLVGVFVVAAGVPEQRDGEAWEGLSGVALGWIHRG